MVAAQKSDGNSVGQLMSYPQTLVKQLDGPGKNNAGIPDVTLRLDAAKWNFDPEIEFTRDDRNPLRDFECI